MVSKSGGTGAVEEKQSLLKMPPKAERWAKEHPDFSLLPTTNHQSYSFSQEQPEAGGHQSPGNVACRYQDWEQSTSEAAMGLIITDQRFSQGF